LFPDARTLEDTHRNLQDRIVEDTTPSAATAHSHLGFSDCTELLVLPSVAREHPVETSHGYQEEKFKEEEHEEIAKEKLAGR
jgi:hypothetical protein